MSDRFQDLLGRLAEEMVDRNRDPDRWLRADPEEGVIGIYSGEGDRWCDFNISPGDLEGEFLPELAVDMIEQAEKDPDG